MAYGRGKNATRALIDFNLRVVPGRDRGSPGAQRVRQVHRAQGAGRLHPAGLGLGPAGRAGTSPTCRPPSAASGWSCSRTRCSRTCGSRRTSRSACARTGCPARRSARRVAEALEMVGMSAYGKRLSARTVRRAATAGRHRPRPRDPTEGPAARRAAGRARRPAASGMLAELQQLRAALPDTAMLYVTHDQSEALALADRIAVMRDARLVDVDTAENLWKRPPSSFTAAFLGGANLLPVHRRPGDRHLGPGVGRRHRGHRARATAGRQPRPSGSPSPKRCSACARTRLTLTSPTERGARRVTATRRLARLDHQAHRRVAALPDRPARGGRDRARRTPARNRCRRSLPGPGRGARPAGAAS